MEKPIFLKSEFINLTRESICFVLSAVDNHYQSYDSVVNSRLTRNYNRDFLVLSSTKCDYASSIKIEFNGDSVSCIKRIGDDTENWQEVHIETYFNIFKRFEELKVLGVNK